MPVPSLLAKTCSRFGTDALSSLEGEFALALYDADNRSLLLAHDMLGQVPIFFQLGTGTIRFASRLDEFRAIFGYSALDEDYILHRLAPGDYFGARTPYSGVVRLLPGQALRFDGNGPRFLDHWTLDHVEPVAATASEASEQLVALVQETIRETTDSGARTWSQLSGGLDSSTVFSAAQRSLPGEVPAMSIVSEKWSAADESEWMRLVIERYPVAWHRINEDDCMPFSGVCDRALGEPSSLDLRPAWGRAHAELMDGKVDVLLTGEGGDSLFFGDGIQGRHLADSFSFRSLLQSLRRLNHWASAEHRSPMFGFVNYVAKPRYRAARGTPLDWMDLRPEWLTSELCSSPRFRRMNMRQPMPRSSSVSNRRMIERLVSLARIISTMQRQLPTRVSIRHPLMNPRLIRFMLGLPDALKFGLTVDRALQRTAFRGIVPDAILDRSGKGYTDQLWVEGLAESPEWHERLTAKPKLADRGIVELSRWRAFVDLMRVAPPRSYMRFNDFAAMEIWLQNLDDFADKPLALVTLSDPSRPRSAIS